MRLGGGIGKCGSGLLHVPSTLCRYPGSRYQAPTQGLRVESVSKVDELSGGGGGALALAHEPRITGSQETAYQ